MKKRLYILTVTILCLAFSTWVEAQNNRAPGYRGKRFIAKVDVVAPIAQNGLNIGIDYVVSRQLAFSINYNSLNKEYTQRLANYKQNFGIFPEEPGTINDKQIAVELQFYPNKSVPAPQGYYILLNYALGIAQATGHVYDVRLGGYLDPYQLDNLRTTSIFMGIGNKQIIRDFFIFEFDFGFRAGNIQLPSTVTDAQAVSFQSFTDKFGPNLYSFGELFSNGGLGLNFHLKVGCLLF